MTDECVILEDLWEYYILLGKNSRNGIFMPLLIDSISKHKIGSCIDSQNIGTLFGTKEAARLAKDMLIRRYSEIKVAKLMIVGHYWREK